MPVPILGLKIAAVIKGAASTPIAHGLSTASNVKTALDVYPSDPRKWKVPQADVVLVHKTTPEWFVRRRVKVGLEAGGKQEWLWVKIFRYVKARGGGWFMARVSDTPITIPVRRRAVVMFRYAQIVDAEKGRT